MPLCSRKLTELGLRPALWEVNGVPEKTDNGNCILDCGTNPIADAAALETNIRAIPGVVGTGLFLRLADTVLVGSGNSFEMIAEKQRV